MSGSLIINVTVETIKITFLIFLMMTIAEIFNVLSKKKIFRYFKKGLRQYILSGILGVIPGCFGSFFAVTLYLHGEISIGSIITNMIATSGDEAYLMLSLFPKKAIFIFLLLFITGIIAGLIVDMFLKRVKNIYCIECEHLIHEESGFSHFIDVHVYRHIIKKHILRIFVFTFIAILISEVVSKEVAIKEYMLKNRFFLLFISSLIGIIPESGPNFVFITLYSKGLIPFSILFANSIVQDGHAMLPLISTAFKDAVFVKIVNFIIGFIVGAVLLLFFNV
mgnify:CR=1 FL=1